MDDRGDKVKRINKEDLARIIIMAVLIVAVAVFWIWDCVHTGKIVWGMGFVVLVLLVILYLNIRAMRNRKQEADIQKELLAYDNIDDRIRLLEDYRSQGKFDDQMNTYHNLLSLCYYEKGDFDRALQENQREREAIERQLSGRTVLSGQPYLVSHANEATFLLAANRVEEAEKCIALVEKELEALAGKKSFVQYVESFRRNVLTPHKAKLALFHHEPRTAHAFIEQLEKIENKREDEVYLTKLLRSEYLLQIGEQEAAVRGLEDIVRNCKTGLVARQAQALKDSLEESPALQTPENGQ